MLRKILSPRLVLLLAALVALAVLAGEFPWGPA
jgi:preprotein translocase subunit Sec61beta